MLPQTERKMRKLTFQPKTTCICRENMVRISEYNSPSKYNKIYKRCVGWLVVWLVIFFFNRTHMKNGYVSDEKSSQNKRWKRKKFRWIFFLIFLKHGRLDGEGVQTVNRFLRGSVQIVERMRKKKEGWKLKSEGWRCFHLERIFSGAKFRWNTRKMTKREGKESTKKSK